MIKLTKRQEQVCGLIAEGCSDREIAEILKIALPTAKLFVYQARTAFKVSNRTSLALAYLEDRGLIKFTNRK